MPNSEEASPDYLRNSAPLPPSILSPQKLFNTIRKAILGSREHNELMFENIPTETGLLVTNSLIKDPDIENACPRINYNSLTQTIDIRIMPTFVHDAHQRWIVNEISRMVSSGFLTQAESDMVAFLVSTTFKGFRAPYSSSVKEPDTCLLPDNQPFPCIVIETGWSDSWAKLCRDKDLWLHGGFPHVQFVF
ncbi:hypothetical protein McanCB56680_006084 [Microsporum canis]|uniref:Uncharacterized protein n=1 Tax=Arthroderma otae (strain ATCC MYA-4605 / CBS 113480) TaxID=554155 RepID=C5FQR0_ARTOC|nr:conserved hypothetical protein [Microsporum canis CBS 113480]EEQ32213.1 conserved hypothetical protein [Microsporum canis CBS 113480]